MYECRLDTERIAKKVANKLIQFTNCRLVRNHQLIRDDFWIRNGKIIDPQSVFFDERMKSGRRIDCNNAIIAPGYIDLQINGGYGVDFTNNTEAVSEGIQKVAEGIIVNGVTSFCPTVITSLPETYRKVLPNIPQKTVGAGILGLHLEGPFINVEKKGAHPPEYIQPLTNGITSITDMYGSLDNVKIITLAPENDESGDVVEQLTNMGITVSLGHSMANLKVGEIAASQGAHLITHLFNAMLPFHHRDPGLVGLIAADVFSDDRIMYFGIIPDGVHTHPAALRIAHRANPEGLICVTDAISALGLEDGIHYIGAHQIEIRNGNAYVLGTDTLCGSTTPMDQCVRILLKSTGCSIPYAIEAATLHPAKCLGIEDTKGTLDYESDADFIMLDDDLNVLSTWINGICAYSCDNSE